MPVDVAACLDLARFTGLSAYESNVVTLDKKLARAAASI